MGGSSKQPYFEVKGGDQEVYLRNVCRVMVLVPKTIQLLTEKGFVRKEGKYYFFDLTNGAYLFECTGIVDLKSGDTALSFVLVSVGQKIVLGDTTG
ncbi:hypothetical protein SEA_VINE_73 [Gordonia phage Vine]|uniref:Uncharacterized protein n=1 Tax=Gordonia phage Vine TaxID=2857501 RepID=A0AAE7XBM8_9CAUD|nr:hypothetical protein PP998_gp73 [Gordonia phage Vine]QZD97782.1 hypothetical protein SEA_VINE_73 [Gordonia phage Vine]